MKPLIFLSFILFSFVCHAQNEVHLCPIEITIQDFEGNPRQGERVLLRDENSDKSYKGLTNAEGFFSIELPGATTYLVQIMGVGEEFDYTQLEIPPLKENELYGTYEVLIQFELPKTFTLDHVYFETGSSALKPESHEELDELFEYLSLKPEVRIEIGGHTDDVGEADANQKLSEKRAKAVKNYLTKKGIKPNRIQAVGYGESRPVALNDGPENRQKNRRTEVKILSGD